MSLDATISLQRQGFSLDVALLCADGETVAVLGPNGAGKTTLLRALAGLEPGAAVRGRPSGPVGYVFQEHRLFPHLSARENVAFGPRAGGTPRAAARAEADRLLAAFGLAGLEGRRI